MGTIGKCCCGCEGCCISRIEVDIGVPNPGQPGTTIGTFGWDIETQPETQVVAQNVNGTVQDVCRQIYTAPVSTIGTFAYNAEFLSRETLIDYDFYWGQGFFGNFPVWFEGQMRWRLYQYARSLALTVYRSDGALSRTVLSGSIAQSVQCQPAIGSRRREYSDTCDLLSDVTYAELGNLVESASSSCRSSSFFSEVFEITHSMITTNTIHRDSGWSAGECNSLPTNDTLTSLIFSNDYIGFTSSSQLHCRMPTGSEFDPLSDSFGNLCGQDINRLQYTYSDEVAFFARNPIRIYTC
jgi:hypothetical protein